MIPWPYLERLVIVERDLPDLVAAYGMPLLPKLQELGVVLAPKIAGAVLLRRVRVAKRTRLEARSLDAGTWYLLVEDRFILGIREKAEDPRPFAVTARALDLGDQAYLRQLIDRFGSESFPAGGLERFRPSGGVHRVAT